MGLHCSKQSATTFHPFSEKTVAYHLQCDMCDIKWW